MPFDFSNVTRFFTENIPSARALAIACPLGLAWAAGCLMFAGRLKQRHGLRTGYTRKIFHFLVFGTAVALHWAWGTPGVCVFGGMASLVIAYALLRGDGHVMFEAMAREKDAPRRSYFIIVPYIATLIGGLAGNILFPATAVFGYLVTGLGDAIAEPVGTRFGRHPYKVPSLGSVKATRSLEGSGAVFLASLLSLTAFFALAPQLDLSAHSLFVILVISAVSTLAEAVSPHGWDNATMQLVPAALGAWLLKS